MTEKITKHQILIQARDDATGKMQKVTKDIAKYYKEMGFVVDKVGKQFKINAEKSAEALKKLGEKAQKSKADLKKFDAEIDKSISAMNKLGTTSKKTSAAHDHMRNRTAALGKTLQNFQYIVSKVRNILLLYFFVYRPLERAIKAVTAAAMDQEMAERKLEYAAVKSQKISGQQVKALKAYAGALQSVTGQSDNDIIKASAHFVQMNYNLDKTKQLTDAAVDLAASQQALGNDSFTASEAAKILGNALSGRVTTLRRYGINISKAAEKTRDFDQIMKEVNDAIGGAGEAFGASYLGSINKVTQAWGDMLEAMGKFFTESNDMKVLLGLLTTKFEDWSDGINDFTENTEKLDGAWRNIVTVLSIARDSFVLISDSIGLVIGYFAWLKKTSDEGFLKGGMREDMSEWDKFLNMWTVVGTWNLFKSIDIGLNTEKSEKEWDGLVKHFQENQLNAEGILSGETSGKFFDMINERRMEIIQKQKAEQREQERLNGLIFDYRKYIKIAKDNFAGLNEEIQKTISSHVFDTLKGEAFELKDVLEDIGDIMLRKAVDTTIEWAFEIGKVIIKLKAAQIVQAASTASGGGFWNTALTIGSAIVGAYTGTSGITMAAAGASMASNANASLAGAAVGSSYTMSHLGGYIRKMKGGGLGSFDTVPALLQPGEGVVSKNGMDSLGVNNLNRLNRGEGGGGNITNNYYSISAIDTESFREMLERNGDIFSASVESDINDNKSIRNTMKMRTQ